MVGLLTYVREAVGLKSLSELQQFATCKGVSVSDSLLCPLYIFMFRELTSNFQGHNF